MFEDKPEQEAQPRPQRHNYDGSPVPISPLLLHLTKRRALRLLASVLMGRINLSGINTQTLIPENTESSNSAPKLGNQLITTERGSATNTNMELYIILSLRIHKELRLSRPTNDFTSSIGLNLIYRNCTWQATDWINLYPEWIWLNNSTIAPKLYGDRMNNSLVKEWTCNYYKLNSALRDLTT